MKSAAIGRMRIMVDRIRLGWYDSKKMYNIITSQIIIYKLLFIIVIFILATVKEPI